jgi:hypothetical protein
LIDTDEIKAVLKSIGDFRERDLHAVKRFFDLDGDGVVSLEEFISQIKKAELKYTAYVKRQSRRLPKLA